MDVVQDLCRMLPYVFCSKMLTEAAVELVGGESVILAWGGIQKSLTLETREKLVVEAMLESISRVFFTLAIPLQNSFAEQCGEGGWQAGSQNNREKR